jgi:quinoprotein glucose dehydrogenase
MIKGRFWTLSIAAVLGLGVAAAQTGKPAAGRIVEWPYYGGDQGGTRYATVDDINVGNASRLTIKWEWKTGEQPLPAFGTRPGAFENTPLMIGNVVYVTTPYNRVVALNAETGAEIWSYDPKPYEDGQPPNGTGFVHRGLAAWRDGPRLRLFLNSRYHLICLDAATGHLVTSFGNKGMVDLSAGLIWSINKKHYTNTSPPIVYKNLVILGNGVGDRLVYRKDPPGDVRAFDARTGQQVWTFHTIPQKGEFGNETWENEAATYTGHTNVWAPMSLDETRGLLYLPVSTPSNDFFGGRRLGANLFGESVVCLDANTGIRKWHYQIVHHGLWDYDPPGNPVLVTMNVDGRRIDAAVQLTKTGFAFAFDRLTGEPVWPIEERPVPQTDVPGERSWPTQPFPTKPPPFTDQGFTSADVIDFTPAIKEAAENYIRSYRQGPLFTPPSMKGTLQRPGLIGGANWGAGAFDSGSGLLYVKSSNQVALARLHVPDRSPANPRADEVDAELTGLGGADADSFMNGLPLNKPPYGRLTAIDLNRGTIAWTQTLGDSPALRAHPALKDVKLPDQLGVPGAAGAIVTAGGLVFVGGGDTAFHAIEAKTGRELARIALPRQVTATPMTYRTRAGTQLVLVATGTGADATLVAFGLP